MIFTEEDKLTVKKFIDIKNKGYYVNGTVLTNLYNKILGKNVSPTNCGSCLRSRVTELENALKQWEANEAKESAKKAEEEAKIAEVDNTPEELKEAVEEAKIAEEENATEEAENNETDNVPQEEEEAVTEQINEENNDVDKQATPAKKPRGKAGRKKGSK